MQNVTELTLKVFEYRKHADFKRSYCTKAWAKEIAQDMVRFYKYLKDVLKNCERVTLTIDENNALHVRYANGGGKICLDTIYLDLLLPEIEALLKTYRKKVKRLQVVKLAA